MTRFTPARLRPSSVRSWIRRRRSMSASRVAAAAAAGAGRLDQALALVDAQRLGVDAGELGGDGDDEDGLSAVTVGAIGHHTPRWRAGRLVAGGGELLHGLALGVGEAGRHRDLDGDEQVARRTSRAATPRPLTRNVRPERVPAGTRSVTGVAVERRHRDVGAERRLRERDRHGEREVVALAAEQRVACRRGRSRRGRRPGRRCGRGRPAPSSGSLALLHPGRDADLDRAGPPLDAGAGAVGARAAR